MQSYITSEKLSELKSKYKKLGCRGLALISFDEYEQVSKRWSECKLKSIYIDWDSIKMFKNLNGELTIEM